MACEHSELPERVLFSHLIESIRFFAIFIHAESVGACNLLDNSLKSCDNLLIVIKRLITVNFQKGVLYEKIVQCALFCSAAFRRRIVCGRKR